MPRRRAGPRLYLRKAEINKRTRAVERHPTWVIKDDGGVVAVTGCAEEDRAGAERVLAQYLAEKYKPERQQDRPAASILVTDVLSIYLEEVAPKHARPAKTSERIVQLAEWWAGKALADVTGKTCRAYTTWRKAQPWKSSKPDVTGTPPRMVSDGGVRRELEDLRAAVNHHRKEGYCREVIEVTLPDKGQPRDRHLERSEAAALLRAMWRYQEMQTRRRGEDAGQVLPTEKRPHRHLARFTLVGMYTGTRAGAICSAAWKPTEGKGWVDVERGVFHRKPKGKRETNKRQPPVRLPQRLVAHLRRWKAKGETAHVVEWREKAVGQVNKGFATAVRNAGLGSDVTPHILRHTCATWLMQRGANTWDAAGYLGITEAMLQRVYGHWHSDYQSEISGGRTDRPPPGLHDIFSTYYHPALSKRAASFLATPVAKAA